MTDDDGPDTRKAACSPAYALASALMHGDPFDNADKVAAAAKEAGVVIVYPATFEIVKALLWKIEAKCHTSTRTKLLELVHEALAKLS